MLDACPHHHEDEIKPDAAALTVAGAADALDGLNLREPRNSSPSKKRLWRSLDELSATPAFEQMLHREFPHAAAEWTDEPSRRNFLKLMGASMALAGLSACTLRKTQEAVVPYVVPPEEVIPGRPLFFATTSPWMGYGKGVVVESHEGRPTKVEGNRDHPVQPGRVRHLDPGQHPGDVRPRPQPDGPPRQRHQHLGRVHQGHVRRDGQGRRPTAGPACGS